MKRRGYLSKDRYDGEWAATASLTERGVGPLQAVPLRCLARKASTSYVTMTRADTVTNNTQEGRLDA